MNYGQENEITDIAVHGNYVYCATMNGIVRWDKRDMSHRKFTMKDGFPHHVVNSIEIDSGGEVWCGTDAGIVRLNGGVVTCEYPHTKVGVLAAGPHGAMLVEIFQYDYMLGWLCEFALYNGSTWTTLPLLSKWPGDVLGDALIVAPDNTIWVLIKERFFRFDGQTLTEMPFSPLAVETGPDGTVWTGTSTGIKRYDGQSWTQAELPFPKSVSALHITPDGTVWAGAPGGLLKYNGTKWTWYDAPAEMELGSYRGIAADFSGTVWIGTPTGLVRYDGVEFTRFLTDEELIHKNVLSIGFEPNGTIWAGTAGGVSRFDGSEWRSFTLADGIPAGEITSVAAISSNNVWIGTAHGAARFDGTAWRTHTTADGLADNGVTSISAGPNGTVWFGTNNGLSRFDGKTWKTYTERDGLFGNRVQSVAATDTGLLWAYSWPGGISRFDGESWSSFATFREEGVSFDLTGGLHVVPGSDGVYAGGNFSGTKVRMPWILHIEKAVSTYAGGPGGRLDGDMRSFAVTPNGTVWFGSMENMNNFGPIGAVRVNSPNQAGYETFAEQDGLAGRVVNAIAIAPDGAVWFGTDRGLSRFEYLSAPSAIGDETAIPEAFAIRGNTPNPFNPSTTISFTLPASGPAELSVYSITGQKVRTLLSGPREAGAHSAVWDGRDDSGSAVSSGVYIARLRAGKTVSSHKMLLMK